MVTECAICGKKLEYESETLDYAVRHAGQYYHYGRVFCEEHAKKIMPVIEDKLAEIGEAIVRIRAKAENETKK